MLNIEKRDVRGESPYVHRSRRVLIYEPVLQVSRQTEEKLNSLKKIILMANENQNV